MALRNRLFAISFAFAVGALAYGCVGDSSTVAPAVDGGGGQDASTSDAGSADAQGMNGGDASDGSTPATDGGGADSGMDAAKQCIYVTDAGAPGSLDQSFSNATHTEVQYTADGDVDAQGNIYALGHLVNCIDGTSGFDIAIYKYLPTGAADMGFGQNGKICLGVPHDATVGEERGRTLRVDPSGNIVVAGATGNGGWNPVRVLVARVKPAGTLDTSFGTNGIYTATVSGLTNGYPVAYDVAFDQSVSPAKILVTGADGDEFKTNVGGFVLRLNSTGQADTGFNAGKPIVDLDATGFYGVTADTAGDVIVTGSANPATKGQRDMIAAKYSVAGAPVTGFGMAGKGTYASLSTMSFSEGRSIAAVASGRVVVAGIGNAEQGPIFTVALTSTGAIDTTFASQETVKGVLRTPSLIMDSDYEFETMRQRCDGRYLVFGSMIPVQAVARVSTAGALEAFGDAGIAASSSMAAPLAAPEDPTTGRIVLIGRDANTNLVLERYQP
jgi:uncharacterized delta-60 repeat protein